LDFYFWGYVKQCLYSVRINNIEHLKARITEVVRYVTPGVLRRVWQELEYRLNVCKLNVPRHLLFTWTHSSTMASVR
jgi:hypothetical protein